MENGNPLICPVPETYVAELYEYLLWEHVTCVSFIFRPWKTVWQVIVRLSLRMKQNNRGVIFQAAKIIFAVYEKIPLSLDFCCMKSIDII
jgi:hypothetical protein